MPFFLNFGKAKKTEIAQRALDLLMEPASVNRRKEQQVRLDYYYDDQEKYVTEAIRKQFKYPDRIALQEEILNLTAMIIDELASIYSEKPFRQLQDVDESEDKFYQDLTSASGLDQTMETANALTKLCKTILVRPVWRDEQIYYDIYTPNMFDVIEDPLDPTRPLGIVYSTTVDLTNQFDIKKVTEGDPFNNENAIFYVWTKEHHFAFSAKREGDKIIAVIKENSENVDNENPYKDPVTNEGVLPFAILRDGQAVDSFFLRGGEDLIATNKIVNVKLSEENYLTKMQSYSIPVRIGASSSDKEFISDPSMTVDLPMDDEQEKGADFKYVSPEARIKELNDSIDKKISRIAIKYKLNPEMFSSSGQKSSAQALQLQNYHLTKIIKRDKPYYAQYEQDIFRLTVIVNNTHNEKQLKADAVLFVDFKDLETPMTVEEKDNHNVLMHNNGLLSRKKWLIDENPDIRDEKQAQEILDEIDKEKKERADQFIQEGMDLSDPNRDRGQGGSPGEE